MLRNGSRMTLGDLNKCVHRFLSEEFGFRRTTLIFGRKRSSMFTYCPGTVKRLDFKDEDEVKIRLDKDEDECQLISWSWRDENEGDNLS